MFKRLSWFVLVVLVLSLLAACGDDEEKEEKSSSSKLPKDVQSVLDSYLKEVEAASSLQPINHKVDTAANANHVDALSLTWGEPVSEAWCVTVTPPVVQNIHDAGSYDRNLVNFIVVRTADTWLADFAVTPDEFQAVFEAAGCTNYMRIR